MQNVYSGYYRAPETGIYKFAVDCDDFCDIWVAGTNVAEYLDEHGFLGGPAPKQRTIFLHAGTHRLVLRSSKVLAVASQHTIRYPVQAV